MTLDDAIKHIEELLENNDFGCEDCKKEHLQLLEWLRELRELKNDNL